MDPYAVLGLQPDASLDDVQRAYRDLAKRFHPDRNHESGELMISINGAYDLLRDQFAAGRPAASMSSGSGTVGRAGPDPVPGDWLPEAVRHVVARELLAVLERDERVDEVLLTSTGDSHDVQLVLTDRRLLWLRDDAIVGRVRYVRWRDVAGVEGRRRAGLLRRGAELRVHARSGRRLRFFELRPEHLARLVSTIAARVTP